MDRLVGGYHVIKGSPSFVIGCDLLSSVRTAVRFFEGQLVTKLTQLKTDESGFIETDSYSFYLFNPGKLVFVSDSSQPGQTRGSWVR